MKILNLLTLLRKIYLPTWDSLRTRLELAKYPKVSDNDGQLILCQVVEDYTFVHRFIHFLLAFSKQKKTKIGWVIIRKRLAVKSLKDKTRYSLFHNFITDFIWVSFYKSIGGKVVIRYEQDTTTKTQAAAWAKKTQNSLLSKQDLVNLTIDGIQVGDLVYDTYLRFKPAPTVDIQDELLLELLTWCWDLYHQLKHFIDTNHPTELVTSYTSYIHHGLLVRIMADRNLTVYSVGVSNQLVVQPTKDFPFHKRNFHKYKEYLRHIDINAAKKEGELIIKGRMEGKIDQATYYMQTSSYRSDKKDTSIFGEGVRPRAIVMGHDFFDSPHIYGKLLFADFYDWIEFIFSEAKNSNYDFFYKAHPNGLPGNNAINDVLRAKFPNIHFIDKTVSNLQILEEGVDIAFSVYGTIAHEFAYKGVPVVSAAENPHVAYRFNICPNSIDELQEYIVGSKKPNLDNSEVPEFCYVHNYRFFDGSMSLFPLFKSDELVNLHFRNNQLKERVDSMIANIKRFDEI